jgi:hypothetical protein
MYQFCDYCGELYYLPYSDAYEWDYFCSMECEDWWWWFAEYGY